MGWICVIPRDNTIFSASAYFKSSNCCWPSNNYFYGQIPFWTSSRAVSCHFWSGFIFTFSYPTHAETQAGPTASVLRMSTGVGRRRLGALVKPLDICKSGYEYIVVIYLSSIQCSADSRFRVFILSCGVLRENFHQRGWRMEARNWTAAGSRQQAAVQQAERRQRVTVESGVPRYVLQ